MGGATSAPLPPGRRALLEEYLRSRGRVPRTGPAVPRRSPGETVPLSSSQEQVWLHAQLAPDIPVYNEAITIHYDGPLDVPAFGACFREIVGRHEAWRTGFVVEDGRPTQRVHDDVSVDLPFDDLRGLPEAERDAEAIRLATEDAKRPIALDRPPLFRTRLVRVADERYRLYLTLSHIIFDGVAIYRVLLPELAALYEAKVAGKASPLPELPFQYPDFACWQRQRDEKADHEAGLAYWRDELRGELPVLDLPFDRPRTAAGSFRGAMHPFVIEEDLARRLRELAGACGVTLFQLLLAGFGALLSRWSGREDVPIGSVTSGRNLPGSERLLGYFLRTVVLRLDVSGDVTFRALLRRAREVTLAALAHDDVPFGTLVRELSAARSPGVPPLFQVLFSLEPPLPPLPPAWRLTQMDVDTGATKYDLYLELDDRSDVILARFHYATDLFDRGTVARMAHEWLTLLAGAAADPDTRVARLPVLPPEERRLLLHTWNATERAYPDATVHELVEAQARLTPDAVAVECDGETLTYAELDQRADRLARDLEGRGVGPDVLVACCMDRSPDLVVALLAILKAGGAYLPLDPAHPEARRRQILEATGPRLVLTTCALAPENARATGRRRETPHDLAYVIATSGSTGAPKGVAVEHRSMVNVLAEAQRELSLREGDVVAGLTTISFDIAGLEVFLPLISGATLVMVPALTARDGVRLARFLDERRPTLVQATPSTWRMLVEAGWRGGPHVQAVSAGEPLARDLAARLSPRCRALWNGYGPSETTIWSLWERVDPGEDGPVPIGRPLANTRAYVLDRNGEPVPIGVAGELFIGGDGVARGYRHRDDLTAERFVLREGERLYRTGDLVRYRADGRIDFLGRNDRQVKIRGHRIELDEIEAALSSLPGVTGAAVELRGEKLVAYAGGRGTPQDLRERLRELLPEVMVPPHFVVLDGLPLTPNGKVDRKRLPEPDGKSMAASSYVPPRTELERRLVAMWEELLEARPVGVEDDFFALGGHSLLAVRLFAAIERELGQSIPLGTLLRAPTVARLAQVLDGAGEPARFTSLVTIQPVGSLAPIFCVHGHFGEVLFYRPLSARLGSAQPFHALASASLSGAGPVHRSIEEMAAHYLAEIRQVRPRGPYALAGYCFGSVVAFEMAQRLLREGETVSFLGLLMGYDRPDPHPLVHKLRRMTDRVRRDGFMNEAGVVATELAKRVKSRLWRVAYARLGERLPERFLDNVPEMNVQAALRYRAVPYPGRMTVFFSGAPDGFVLDSRLDLCGLEAREVEVHRVPGNRDSMMREPHVAVLAQKIEESLAHAARP